MKRLTAVMCLLSALAWGDASRSKSNALALTAALPTDFTTGLNLLNVNGFRVSVCAELTRTLSGAGALNAYFYDHNTGLLTRNPGLDLPISVTATSCAGAACRCQTFPDMTNANPAMGGQVFFLPNAVTVSGGTTVTVRIEGWVVRGGP